MTTFYLPIASPQTITTCIHYATCGFQLTSTRHQSVHPAVLIHHSRRFTDKWSPYEESYPDDGFLAGTINWFCRQNVLNVIQYNPLSHEPRRTVSRFSGPNATIPVKASSRRFVLILTQQSLHSRLRSDHHGQKPKNAPDERSQRPRHSIPKGPSFQPGVSYATEENADLVFLSCAAVKSVALLIKDARVNWMAEETNRQSPQPSHRPI